MNEAAVPVLVEEEAARRLKVLNAQHELEGILEWARNNVYKLCCIRVLPSSDPAPNRARLVVIKAHCIWDDEVSPTHLPEWEFAGWKCLNLSHALATNVILSCTFQPMPEQ